MKDEDREQKKWWAIHEDGVVLTTGYSCAPVNTGYWWCASLGWSMQEGKHLFETEGAATDALIVELNRKVVESQEIITALKLRRSTLK